MKDGYNRNINYMRLSVTDKCNYKCNYCVSENCSILQSELSFDELYNICVAAVDCGVNKIRITGGEPLVRKGVIDFCSRLSALDGLNELAITTNGSLLKEYAACLREVGVGRLNISLDTLNADKFKHITQVDDLQNVLLGLDAAKKCGFENIKINVVLMNGINTDEIADIVELTKDNNYSVRFIELMPIGDPSFDRNKHYISADTVIDAVPKLKRVSFDGVSQIYKADGYTGTVGLIRPISGKFCDVCNRIRVTTDGKLKPCLYSSDEYDLRNLSYDELVSTFKDAIKNKPSAHSFGMSCGNSTHRSMNQIGG